MALVPSDVGGKAAEPAKPRYLYLSGDGGLGGHVKVTARSALALMATSARAAEPVPQTVGDGEVLLMEPGAVLM